MADEATRGALEIRPKALRTVAEGAAREVAGVTTREPTIGRHLPRVTVEESDDGLRIRLATALAWDRPLAALAAELRDHVRDRVAGLTGMPVLAVDVDVAALDRAQPPASDAPRDGRSEK